MKIVKDILYKSGIEEVVGNSSVAVDHIAFDSRDIGKMGLFVAVKGQKSDGHSYISQVISTGAIAIVCEVLPKIINPAVVYIKVKDSRRALGEIASNFYDRPSEKLDLVGVTGTNGKTTTTSILHRLFSRLAVKSGLISTVEIKITDKSHLARYTTPDPIELNKVLAEMVEAKCKVCFMEVSSHAIDQMRIAGLRFRGGVFTNLTHDHLDYHKTIAAYRDAKKKFFDDLPSTAFALYNKDDKNGQVMVQNTKAKIASFSVKGMADFNAKVLESGITGLLLLVNGQELWSKLSGRYNAYNLIAAFSVSSLLGKDTQQVLTALSLVEPVEGRFQYFKDKQDRVAIVDYAHTPDALENVLKAIKEINYSGHKIITVIGCGGNRDMEKRPLMGKIAANYSDKVILTSDNPRDEDPERIIQQMLQGIQPDKKGQVMEITDRKQAIKTACNIADKGDVILIAGKGHEKYQEINGNRTPFSDWDLVLENMSEK